MSRHLMSLIYCIHTTVRVGFQIFPNATGNPPTSATTYGLRRPGGGAALGILSKAPGLLDPGSSLREEDVRSHIRSCPCPLASVTCHTKD